MTATKQLAMLRSKSPRPVECRLDGMASKLGANNGGPGWLDNSTTANSPGYTYFGKRMESDVLYVDASSHMERATILAQLDYTDASFTRKIIVDNGGPQTDLVN